MDQARQAMVPRWAQHWTREGLQDRTRGISKELRKENEGAGVWEKKKKKSRQDVRTKDQSGKQSNWEQLVKQQSTGGQRRGNERGRENKEAGEPSPLGMGSYGDTDFRGQQTKSVQRGHCVETGVTETRGLGGGKDWEAGGPGTETGTQGV